MQTTTLLDLLVGHGVIVNSKFNLWYTFTGYLLYFERSDGTVVEYRRFHRTEVKSIKLNFDTESNTASAFIEFHGDEK